MAVVLAAIWLALAIFAVLAAIPYGGGSAFGVLWALMNVLLIGWALVALVRFAVRSIKGMRRSHRNDASQETPDN